MSSANGRTDTTLTDIGVDGLKAGSMSTCKPAALAGPPVPSADPPSPCTGVCRLNANRLCEGCYRTPAEIGRWSVATPAEKAAIWQRLATRRPSDDRTDA